MNQMNKDIDIGFEDVIYDINPCSFSYFGTVFGSSFFLQRNMEISLPNIMMIMITFFIVCGILLSFGCER